MHNTGFFPDCHLLSLTGGSIWMPYLARYSEIFKKFYFQVVKWKSTLIGDILSRRNWKPKDHVWLQSLVCLPPLYRVEILRLLEKIFAFDFEKCQFMWYIEQNPDFWRFFSPTATLAATAMMRLAITSRSKFTKGNSQRNLLFKSTVELNF